MHTVFSLELLDLNGSIDSGDPAQRSGTLNDFSFPHGVLSGSSQGAGGARPAPH